MTLSVRSSSLHDTTSLQRLGVVGALAASILVIGLAVQMGPLTGIRSATDDAAVSNTSYTAAPGVSDSAGEHIGLGTLDFDYFRGWQQAPSKAIDQAAIDAARHRHGPFRKAEPPTRIGGR